MVCVMGCWILSCLLLQDISSASEEEEADMGVIDDEEARFEQYEQKWLWRCLYMKQPRKAGHQQVALHNDDVS